jgi:hypothetical protein
VGNKCEALHRDTPAGLPQDQRCSLPHRNLHQRRLLQGVSLMARRTKPASRRGNAELHAAAPRLCERAWANNVADWKEDGGSRNATRCRRS